MDVDCEGCAGCCVDWHVLAPDGEPPSRSGPRTPLDGALNFVPLERDEVRTLLDAGLGDATTPRLWTYEPEEDATTVTDGQSSEPSDGSSGESHASSAGGARAAPAVAPDQTVTIDGYDLIAARGRPVFYVGLRKPPKPVAPAGREEPTWLPTCAFLDPETLQCRVHGEDAYPDACAAYPGYNLALDQETECERVEAAGGGERLLDDEPPADLPGVGLGPQALGGKLFAHPEPGALEGTVERLATGEATDADRATFVAVAAASSPGTLAVAEERREDAYERALEADSWVGRAIADWEDRAGELGESGSDCGDAPDADPSLGRVVEGERGAPSTPGWE